MREWHSAFLLQDGVSRPGSGRGMYTFLAAVFAGACMITALALIGLPSRH